MQTLGVSVKQLRRKLLELGARILHVQGSKPRDMALVVRVRLENVFSFLVLLFSYSRISVASSNACQVLMQVARTMLRRSCKMLHYPLENIFLRNFFIFYLL